MTCFGPIRELASQDKLKPQHLDRRINPETQTRSTYLGQKPLEPSISNFDELVEVE